MPTLNMDDHVGHRKHLYMTTIIASISYAAVGSIFSWTSPTLPRLKESNSRIPLTEEEGSWVASLIAVGGAIGPLISGKLLDSLGRKWTIVSAALFLILAWIVLGIATCVEMLYIGRFIAGFSAGLILTGVPMYISEVSDDSSRGMLSSTMELSLAFGFNLQYFAGPYLSYINLIYVSAVVPIVFIMMFVWIPDTPYYLLAKGDKYKALNSLRWFRGNVSLDCAEKEIVIIESTMYEMMKKKESFWKLMKLSNNQKAMMITSFLMIAQQFSGINVLQLYAESIFIASGTSINPAYCAMAVGSFQFISSALAGPIAKRYGFKKPLLIASVLIAIEHFILGLYLYFASNGVDVSSVDWLPVTCLILYILSYSATYGPLPWGVLCEMFPTNVKAAASSTVTAVNFFSTFLATKFFSNISDAFGMYVSFWIFTVTMIIAFFFILIVQPNTKGMSLQDVQDELTRRTSRPNDGPT